jgi:ubiquinone/menaquinone biosynthesis C-methylase UbiE
MTQRGDRALARQLERYYVRFNEDFWAFFAAEVEPLLPAGAVLTDLGCGPGLYLRDVSERLPEATLIGVDRGDDMLGHARSLTYAGATPTFESGDVAGTLPLADGSVDLLTIAAVMHTFVDPFAFLKEVRRVLAPGGLFLLYDWVRVGFQEYIEYREKEAGDPVEARYPRALELFSIHNKYTEADWRWIFDEARFLVVHEARPYPRAIALLARPE